MKRRKTPSKEKILAILASQSYATSHEAIANQIDDINRATIYRILNQFCEDGIAHRISAENGKQFFALCKDCKAEEHHHNHLHFQCNSCEKVECFESEINIAMPSGYAIEKFNGLISGFCNLCAPA